MALVNKKLTELTEAASTTEDALIHIVEPDDISQSPTGSSYKIKKSNFLQEVYSVMMALLGTKLESVQAGTNVTVDNTDPLNPIVSASGGGATNLGYTASPTNGIVTSDTGTDATLPLADATNAGLLKPAKFTVLENTSGTNSGDNATNTQYSGLAGEIDALENTVVAPYIEMIDFNGAVLTSLANSRTYVETFSSATKTNELYYITPDNWGVYRFSVPIDTDFDLANEFCGVGDAKHIQFVDKFGLARKFGADAFALNLYDNVLGRKDGIEATDTFFDGAIPKTKNTIYRITSLGTDGFKDYTGRVDINKFGVDGTQTLPSDIFTTANECLVVTDLANKYNDGGSPDADVLQIITNLSNVNSAVSYDGVDGGSDVVEVVKTLNTSNSETYGDSITIGSGSTSGNSYRELITALYTLTNTSRAVSGSGIYSALSLFYANINPAHGKVNFLMSGFNDVRRGGSGVKTTAKLTNGYRGFIVNHFLDRYYSGNSGHASIVTSGTWTSYAATTVGGKTAGAYSSVNGNYMEYTFTDNNVVVAMISGDGVAEVHGTFTVHIDGVLQGSYTLNEQTDGISDGVNSNTRASYMLYFGGLEDATHVIKITHTNTATLPIDFFGNLKQPKFSNPLVLLEAPKMNSTGYAISPANATDGIIDALNVSLNTVVSEFSTDYPIYVSQTNDYYDVTTGLSVDNIHPNDVGYRQIYTSVYEKLRTLVVDKSVAVSVLTTNNTWTGTNDYSQRIKANLGLQVQGQLSSPTGAGIELEYNAGDVYLTSYNRTSSAWLNKIIRALTIRMTISGSEVARFMSDGLLIGTTSGDGVNKLQVNGNVKSSQYRLSALNTAPATSTSTGTLGEIRIDASYIYVCTATNTWVRSPLSTF